MPDEAIQRIVDSMVERRNDFKREATIIGVEQYDKGMVNGMDEMINHFLHYARNYINISDGRG